MTAIDDLVARLVESAGVVSVRVGAWQEFGYEKPLTPECAVIPPLGERGPGAIQAGHGAVEEIDAMLRDLHALRQQLVTELRTNQDKLAERVDAVLAARRQA